MDVRMTGNNISISDALNAYTERRLRSVVGEDAYATVDKAASRLKLAVARRIGRRRSVSCHLLAPAYSS